MEGKRDVRRHYNHCSRPAERKRHNPNAAPIPSGKHAAAPAITVGEQKKQNVMLNENTSRQDFIQNRETRDKGLAVPKLLLPSIQTNLRGGKFAPKEDNGTQYIKIPINAL